MFDVAAMVLPLLTGEERSAWPEEWGKGAKAWSTTRQRVSLGPVRSISASEEAQPLPSPLASSFGRVVATPLLHCRNVIFYLAQFCCMCFHFQNVVVVGATPPTWRRHQAMAPLNPDEGYKKVGTTASTEGCNSIHSHRAKGTTYPHAQSEGGGVGSRKSAQHYPRHKARYLCPNEGGFSLAPPRTNGRGGHGCLWTRKET